VPDATRNSGQVTKVTTRGCLIIGLLMSGCGLGPVLEFPISAPAPEPNFRQLIADNSSLLKSGSRLGLIEVSALRASKPLQPGDWMACVRSTVDGQTAYFAIFFKAHLIEAERRAIAVDNCEDETFEALPKPMPPKPVKN
jgi:hypothetical protein